MLDDYPVRDAILEYVAPGSSKAVQLSDKYLRWSGRRKSLPQSGSRESSSMAPHKRKFSIPSQDTPRSVRRQLLTPQSNRSMQSVNPFARRGRGRGTRKSSVTQSSVGRGTVNQVAVVKRKGRAPSSSIVKKVKVSKQFKAKVTKVFENRKPTGFYEMIQNGNILSSVQDGQTVTTLPAFAQNVAFSANVLLNACSRLFKGKGSTNSPLIGDTSNYSPVAFEADILSNYAMVNLKNNSFRTYYLKFYVCYTKNQQVPDSAAGMWNNALTLLNTASAALSGTC